MKNLSPQASTAAGTIIAAAVLFVVATAFRCPGPEPSAAEDGGDGLGGNGLGGNGLGGSAGGGDLGGFGPVGGFGGEGGGCVDTLFDVNNCGACGRVCSPFNVATPSCTLGVCNSSCQPGSMNVIKPAFPEQDDGCETPGRRVFVSTEPYKAGQLGGVLKADALCTMLANDAGMTGSTWMAWLSDALASPATRFNKSTIPYRLVDGTLVADNWTDLTDGQLYSPINSDPFGAPFVDAEVWTNTALSGEGLGYDCLRWTYSDPNDSILGYVGRTVWTSQDWTEDYPQFCDRDQRIYCFEQ